MQMRQLNTNISYRGGASRDGPHVLIDFRGIGFTERNVWRLSDPLHSEIEAVFGIFLSLDHDKKITSGGVLISKTKLENELAAQMIKEKVKRSPNRQLLYVVE